MGEDMCRGLHPKITEMLALHPAGHPGSEQSAIAAFDVSMKGSLAWK
jgi:hypothetical protein